ncbi:penicillin acylase family protein [Pseudoalteromonas tunicata]|uniref:penicillin acylase family protein n=1 Tax=Pseudoalteromonas tunicata TaxID=314281 RepID=UPI00273DBBD7|nr:penicillin acylase family protein [Pseudoalteromonas tunicata]MDP5214576.1 penicillin acylase family protein [Pseudoalteromonas tunicata]
MLRFFKWLTFGLILLALLTTAVVYGILSLSLPSLSGKGQSAVLSEAVSIERDALGSAVIVARNRVDAAYALGFAHGQDRFFQMDLLRRNAAGELSELFGAAAINLDKTMRFHQLRKRATAILATLPEREQKILKAYSEGVNEAQAQSYPSFEYILTGAERKPWQAADSLLVIYTMYLDLQAGNFERDLVLTQIEQQFGKEMLAFVTQPSRYQAALDGSEIAKGEAAIPQLAKQVNKTIAYQPIAEPLGIGSNNWAVTGQLTQSGHGMLSDDMHLSIAVPVIWYRAQLNYQENNQAHQITGVSLPGAPAIVVGSNGHVAWGFTNGYLDTADWIKLPKVYQTHVEIEQLTVVDGTEQVYELEMSEFGPVKTLNGERYALSWVAHQNYAVDMELLKLEQVHTVAQALEVAKTIGIPVQNMLVVDNAGNAAWQPTGAVPARTNPSDVAIESQAYSNLWQYDADDLPSVLNPDNQRLWTGNSRVISASQLARFGDGGYAIGARAAQIRDRLNEKQQFSESDFYKIQLDNEARFLTQWHELLLTTLKQQPERYALDIAELENWQACACPESVGYTLVRYYRSRLIDTVFATLESNLSGSDLSLSAIKSNLETPIWQLIAAQPSSWLPEKYSSWHDLMRGAYEEMRDDLLVQYGQSKKASLKVLKWGDVNQLKIQHPFSKQMPLLSNLLDMPMHQGFGDSFMPAVQKTSFGASQRLFVQPGLERNAILTLPGGQSGHPLSPFYRAGFDDYVNGANTPLLPGERLYQITIEPSTK